MSILEEIGIIIVTDVRAHITRSPGPSVVGTPPNTRRGKLPRSIGAAIDSQTGRLVVGSRASVIGHIGGIHEKNKSVNNKRYGKRAFMGPSLSRTKKEFPGLYKGLSTS